MDPVLIGHVREPNSFTLDFYLQHGGYDALKSALTKKPDEIIDIVKASGLRGRGGAGFPTGMKWQFVDKKIEPRYIVCNADESEPGTFKDHLLMERNPHLLIEGCAIGCYAIGAKVAYIYIRGEFFHVQGVLEQAIDNAYAKGYLGKNIFGTGFDVDLLAVVRGAHHRYFPVGELGGIAHGREGHRGLQRLHARAGEDLVLRLAGVGHHPAVGVAYGHVAEVHGFLQAGAEHADQRGGLVHRPSLAHDEQC